MLLNELEFLLYFHLLKIKMKIILLADIDNLGKKNDILDVSDGYAKNFLFKKKLAIQYNKNSKARLDTQISEENYHLKQKENWANEIKQALEKKEYIFYLKSNNGKSFGNISIKEVLNLVNVDFKDIDKYMIISEKKCWDIGIHKIKVKIFNNVIANINIKVLEE